MVLGAAAVTEPAHQRPVLPDHLHAVDAEIEIIDLRIIGSLGHHQRPGDERRRLAGPAGLHRQRREIDVGTLQHDLLAGRARDQFGLAGERGLDQRQHLDRLAQPLGRLGVVEEGQHLTQGAKPVHLAAHRPGDALDGAEQVGQHRDIERRPVLADGVLEQDSGAVLGQQPGLDLGDLVLGRDRV